MSAHQLPENERSEAFIREIQHNFFDELPLGERRELLFHSAQHSDLWQALHEPSAWKQLVTVSTVASMVGFGYESPTACYKLMKGETTKTHSEFAERNHLAWGRIREEKALDDFKTKHPQYSGIVPGMWLGTEFPRIAASLDFLGIDMQTFELMSVEIKCPHGQSIPEYPKNPWLIQMQLQMLVTGIRTSFLHVWTPTGSITSQIYFDQKLCDLILEELDRFYFFFNSGTPPPKGGKYNAQLGHYLSTIRNKYPLF